MRQSVGDVCIRRAGKGRNGSGYANRDLSSWICRFRGPWRKGCMLGRQRALDLGISCCGCCRLERVENRCGSQLRRLTGAQRRVTNWLIQNRRSVATHGVRAVAAVSGSDVVGKGGSEWDIGECGVCGQWASGTRLPSGNRRHDGTTPMDNFVCFRCQEEARVLRGVSAACDRQQPRPNATREKMVKKSKNGLTVVHG